MAKDYNWMSKLGYVLEAPDYSWLEAEANALAEPTPLAKMFGFEVSEDAYDRLNFSESLVADLITTGYNQTQIAWSLGIAQPTVSVATRRIAYKLADSKLRLCLDARQEYRSGHHTGF